MKGRRRYLPLSALCRVWRFDPGSLQHAGLACGGFSTLAAQAEKVLVLDPYSGHLFVFRGRRVDLLKIIWRDTQGACLFGRRLEKGRFVWPAAKDGKICVTPARLSMRLEGIDWRMPQKTW